MSARLRWPVVVLAGLVIALLLPRLGVPTFSVSLLTQTWIFAIVAMSLDFLIGFTGLGGYPTLLRALARVEGDEGLSVTTLGEALGLGSGAARALAAGLAVVLLAAAWRVRKSSVIVLAP